MQFQKPYSSNFNSSSNKNYGNSSYQNVVPQTRGSKIEAMIDQVLEGQQKLMVNVNEKIYVVYTELNTKFETLNTHVQKLDTQVVQRGDDVKRQDTLIKGK